LGLQEWLNHRATGATSTGYDAVFYFLLVCPELLGVFVFGIFLAFGAWRRRVSRRFWLSLVVTCAASLVVGIAAGVLISQVPASGC
jgi:hypothetical protein